MEECGTGWSWVELGAPFSNTRLEYTLKLTSHGILLYLWSADLSKTFSHFKLNFQNGLNLHCSFSGNIRSTTLFPLHCPILNDNRHILLSTLSKICSKILQPTNFSSTQALLFASTSFDKETNTFFLNATIN